MNLEYRIKFNIDEIWFAQDVFELADSAFHPESETYEEDRKWVAKLVDSGFLWDLEKLRGAMKFCDRLIDITGDYGREDFWPPSMGGFAKSWRYVVPKLLQTKDMLQRAHDMLALASIDATPLGGNPRSAQR